MKYKVKIFSYELMRFYLIKYVFILLHVCHISKVTANYSIMDIHNHP